MAEKDDKSLNLEEFKERVYKRLGYIEALDEGYIDQKLKEGANGCLGIIIMPFGGVLSRANKKARKELKIEELAQKADALLAQNEIKELLCANLDATVRQPIEVAYKITPVLYDLAKKDEEKVPLNSYFFAIVCRKIADKGVASYCDTKPKKGKKQAPEKPEAE